MADAPTLTLIAALDQNRVIGLNGGMPWHIPGDLPRFKRLTRHKPVLMGRKTFESIGRALPERQNLVLSHRDALDARSDITRVSSLAQAIDMVGDAPEIMIMGGAELYGLALPRASRMLLTHIDAAYEGDTFFPLFDDHDWQITSCEHVAADDPTPAHRFVTWTRREA